MGQMCVIKRTKENGKKSMLLAFSLDLAPTPTRPGSYRLGKQKEVTGKEL
jgi:hypothetical protein